MFSLLLFGALLKRSLGESYDYDYGYDYDYNYDVEKASNEYYDYNNDLYADSNVVYNAYDVCNLGIPYVA